MADPTIWVVEDDLAVQESISWTLRQVAAKLQRFQRPSEILQQNASPTPGCLIVDYQLPEMNGLDLLKSLRANHWRQSFLVITGYGEVPLAVSAMQLGAVSFLEKPLVESDLIRCVRDAIDVDQQRYQTELQISRFREKLSRLTRREHEVLTQVIEGKLNKQIAQTLGIAVKTVETHRGHLTKKLEVDSVAQLVRMMIQVRQSA